MTEDEIITAALTSGPLADELTRRAREGGRTYTSQEVAEMVEDHQWSAYEAH